MIHKILLAIGLIIISSVSNAQTRANSYEDSIIDNRCDGRIFTRVEISPSVKNGLLTLEDSLTLYFQTKKILKQDFNVRVHFLITTQSEVVMFEPLLGTEDFKHSKIIEDALKYYQNLWIPAKQNSYSVCAFVGLEFKNEDEKLSLTFLK